MSHDLTNHVDLIYRGGYYLEMGAHLEHKKIHSRLKRLHGHLGKVIEMIESRTSCLEVAQQLQAVESALVSAKKAYIYDHVDHCLANMQDKKSLNSKLEEFKEISKYL